MTMYQNLSKEVEKVFTYKDLILEIQSMWNLKAKMITVIKEATYTFPKSLRKYLSKIIRKHEIKEQQKTAIMGTAHVLRNVLM